MMLMCGSVPHRQLCEVEKVGALLCSAITPAGGWAVCAAADGTGCRCWWVSWTLQA
jgi:hypothetical protein